jgi:hypothetical protein
MVGLFALLTAMSAIAGPSAPVLDPNHLPQLPGRGLARETAAGVELQTMRGRSLGVIPRLNLAADVATSRDLLLRDRRGSLYMLDRRARRVRQVSDGPPPRRACRVTDRRAQLRLVVCKSTIKLQAGNGGLRIVARAPGKVGHWERAAFAPRSSAFFAQWSAECEVPVAFFISGGVMRPFGASTMANAPSSSALGWLPNGSAVAHFPAGPCGKSQGAPGVYLVPIRGMTTLLVATPKFEYYWMWGG